MKQNIKEFISECIYQFIPVMIWASIILSITVYETKIILPIVIENGLFIKHIGYAPCYIAILLYIPFRISNYFYYKTKHFLHVKTGRIVNQCPQWEHE